MALVAASGLLALLVLVALYLLQKGPRRAGLAALAVSIALVPPTCGIGAASLHLLRSFGEMALVGEGGAAAITEACQAAARFMRVGNAIAALMLLLSLVLGWIGRSGRGEAPPASPRRLALLVVLTLLPPLLVGGLFEYARRTNRIAAIVVGEVAPLRPPASPEDEEYRSPAASIAATSRRVATGAIAGSFASPLLLVVLAGFASAGAILAWRVEVPTAFALYGTLLVGLVAVASLVSIVFFKAPVALP